MTEETITYSKVAEGFPSRYSFIPEAMIGIGNSFYTFKGGDIWQHSTNEIRNNFYGVQYSSKVTTVLNEGRGVNKLVKAIGIESNEPWDVNAIGDVGMIGIIEAAWFEKEEGLWFASLRNVDEVSLNPEELFSRFNSGIGQSISIDNTIPSARKATFPLTMNIGSMVSFGDYLYYSMPPYTSPLLAGKIIAVNVDIPNSINEIIYDATAVTGSSPSPIQDPFLFYVKNSMAESSGVLARYCELKLINGSISHVEMFAVNGDVMKSFP